MIQESQHTIIDLDWKIVTDFIDFVFDFLLQLRVDGFRECFNALEVVDSCSLVVLIRNSVAFALCCQVQSVNSGNQFRNFVLKARFSRIDVR